MSERKIRWLGEFILIVVGVLTAFAVNDLSQVRDERALERHLLAGVREDLMRDTTDSGGAIRAAQGRAAASDEILKLAHDPFGGRIPDMGRKLDQHLQAARLRFPSRSFSAEEALIMMADQRRLDVSTPTFSEAIARGGLDKIRDVSLRSMISTHYADAGRYVRTDDRTESVSLHFRGVLAEAGLAPGDDDNAEEVLDAIRGNRVLLAEIKTLREYALRQIEYQTQFMQSADAVLAAIDAWLAKQNKN